jgi:N-acetylated-alpha-linked acidic dipeptidase
MPPTESTPLITTVTVTAPPRRKLYGHDVCRRFCSIALASLLVYSALSFILSVMIDWPESHHHHRKPYEDGGLWSALRRSRSKVSHEEVLRILMDTPEAERAEEWSRYYTSGPHLAGKNLSQAEWTKEKWESWGVKSEIVAYEVYLNYPEDHSLSMLTKKKGKKKDGAEAWKVAFEASLAEDVLEEDPTSQLNNRIMTFHGYSANGNVTAPFVYVNYGTYQDYEDLRRANVSLEGKIALARYGHVFRGLKIKRAQELGMVGCLLYSDPGDDGEFTEENGYEAYPEGPARNPSSVQRGSANFLSIRPGDP